MAELVGDAVRSDPSLRFVVLLGGAHISKLSGVPFPGVDSMASLLVSQGMSPTSLTAIFREGAFWGCLVDGGGNCGPHEFPTGGFDAQIAGRSPGVYLSDEIPGYDGLIIFEQVTPAEPANPAADTGDLIWEYRVGNEVAPRVLYDDKLIFQTSGGWAVTAQPAHLVALDARTGALVWDVEMPDPYASNCVPENRQNVGKTSEGPDPLPLSNVA